MSLIYTTLEACAIFLGQKTTWGKQSTKEKKFNMFPNSIVCQERGGPRGAEVVRLQIVAEYLRDTHTWDGLRRGRKPTQHTGERQVVE